MSEPTPAGIAVLEAIARFQYLNVPLVERLGIATMRTARDKLFPALVSRKMVIAKRYKALPGRGSIPVVYSLASNGARFLEAMKGLPEGDIVPAPSVAGMGQDHDHRMTLVAFHIELAKWIDTVDGRLDRFDRYYGRVPDPSGRSLVSATTIFHRDKRISSDAVILISGPKPMFFALEIHHSDNTTRIIDQLAEYLPFLMNGAFEKKYGTEHAPFVLSVFDEPNTLRLVKRRFLEQANLRQEAESFLFISARDALADISSEWHYASDKPVRIFPQPMK